MRTKHKLIAYFLAFALLLGMISTVNVSAAKKISLSNKKITITKGSSKTIKVKNTKKKVKWKVLSGKKCITLKKKGKTAATVKGKKKGKAKIQALVEKKKLVCTVTVDDKVISEQQNNPQTPSGGKPIQTPNAVTPTEPPYQEGIITLHYNDDNAHDIKEQIQNSEIPVHVIVDEGVTSIVQGAFQGCSNLASIEIPGSVSSIGDSAFSGCSSLTSIKVAENNKIYDSRDNCNAIIETEINKLIVGCKNTKIPESVTSIGEYAFQGCDSLTDIEIPESVTSIEGSAFFGCSSLMCIEIPESVTSIGYGAFSYCNGLSSIKVSENNQIYDSRNDCNAIIETETNTLIIGCKSTKIPGSTISIGAYAFHNCSSLTSIEIPDSVTSIGKSAFSACDITSIEIPRSVTSIGEDAFDACFSLTDIKILGSVTSINGGTFLQCNNLTHIEIPESVTSIGDWAFGYCYNLTSIDIPESVTSIDYYAFIGCSNLTSIIWQDTTYSSVDEFMNAFHTKYPDF